MKLSLKREDFLLVYALLTTSFYFLDMLYIGKELITLIRISILALSVLLFGIPRSIPLMIFALLSFYLIGNVGKFFLPSTGLFAKLYFSGVLLILALYLFRLTPQEYLNCLRKFVNIFCYVNLLSVVVWFFLLIGIPMDYEIIHLNGRDLDYRKYYWVAIFCDWTIYTWNGIEVARNGGLFEEPGMFGTYSGLLLALVCFAGLDGKFAKLTLTIFGLTSFSLSFFMFGVIILLYHITLSVRSVGQGLLVGVCLFVLSKPYHFIFENMLFSRFGAGGALLGTSRLSDADKLSAHLEDSDWLYILVGNGIGSNRVASEAQFSGYGSLIYEYGLVGFVILLCLFGWYYVLKPLHLYGSRVVLLTIIPVLSLYQRPDFASGIMLLFWLLVMMNDRQIFSGPRSVNYET